MLDMGGLLADMGTVQVANPDFFLKMVPLMDGGDDVGMVLSPQSFHNLQPHADIFNHANIQFWEYAQHGYDAIDFISCTGACHQSCSKIATGVWRSADHYLSK